MCASCTVLVILLPLPGFCLFLGVAIGLCLANTGCGSPSCEARPHCTIWVFVFPFIPPAFREWGCSWMHLWWETSS